MADNQKALTKAVKSLYEKGETDYYLPPIVVTDEQRKAIGRICDGDSVIFCCRRGDREYQLTKAYTDSQFYHFKVKKFSHLTFVTFTRFYANLSNVLVLFEPHKLSDTFGEVISNHGLKQARVAESEKFSHVTYFFNCHRIAPFPGENDISIPSPKNIEPYQSPQLSASKVADKAAEILSSGSYSFVLVNFANGDVIGHFPHRKAQLACAHQIDKQLAHLVRIARKEGYLTAIAADHGVFEQMRDEVGEPSVRHTQNPVPFILIPPHAGSEKKCQDIQVKPTGILSNIAPTLLDLMNLPIPSVMNQRSLIAGNSPGCKVKKVLLVILDGWGIGNQDKTNPIYLAETYAFDSYWSNFPHSILQASGEAVGLLSSSPGNSEAGHTNIAAGRIVLQDEVRIDQAISDETLETKTNLLETLRNASNNNSNLHLIGLLSDKSSHGRMRYLLAVLKAAKKTGFPEDNLYIHLITDGRSTRPGTVPQYISHFNRQYPKYGSIVTLVGRGLALDRDRDWKDKTKVVYDALTYGRGIKVTKSDGNVKLIK